MERHPAFPNLQGVQRVLQIVRSVVEDHITDTATEDNSKDRPDDEVVEIQRAWTCRVALRKAQTIAPAKDNPDDICQRIPTYRQRTNLNSDWIN
jgi:hypothetical protein